jgi:cellulase (glycosyl hydrolase family 5)
LLLGVADVRAIIALLVLLCASTLRAEALRALHVCHEGPSRISDDLGRQVLLRGVNVNQLGEYYRPNSSIPSTVPLESSDLARIAGLGMNVVRLIVHWSRLEPMKGFIDPGYLAEIRQAVEWAAANDIYVVLDMHQDAWGMFIDTPPGETCLPGFQRAVGWDGAPRWATFTDGLPTCRFQLRELAPAVAQAFESFWIDRDGIQTELVNAWAALAAEFAADPTVAGYDFLNEPHPGWTPGATEISFLGLFYRRVLEAIREVEDETPGGFHHIGFFEPMDHWSALSIGFSPEPFTLDRNMVFAPHLYAGSLTADGAVGLDLISISFGFEEAEREAARYGTTFWSGEWGWFGDPATQSAQVKEYARNEDEHLVGGAWWQWKQSCGDPHTIGTQAGAPPPTSGNLVLLSCPLNGDMGLVPQFAKVLARGYPRAAPGRLRSLASDSDAGVLDLSGEGSGVLDVWVPVAPTVVTPTGLSAITVTPSLGGFRVRATASGDYALHLAR